MQKVILFSVFLLSGLVISQILPIALNATLFSQIKTIFDTLMFICLAFIMINVGKEFELDKSKWHSYGKDYMIAMATAAAPWLFIAVYFMFLLPSEYIGNWDAWKENLLMSRFAAPTSAGILFTMLAAAGLRQVWIYKKTQILAIFDDLDTILLMIPLQIFMIGFKWQLFVVIFIVIILLWLGWKKQTSYDIPQGWIATLTYAIIIVGICSGITALTHSLFGSDGEIHIEVLLPAFILGMIIKAKHVTDQTEIKITDSISYLFMLLVGLSTPLFIRGDMAGFESETGGSITAAQPMLSWGMITFHVIMVTALSNIGKMFPVFFYRDRHIYERLALSIGMFTRGEVGAGIIIIAMGYSLGGPALIIAILSLVLNLILTGGFVMIVKQLARKVYGAEAVGKPDTELY